MKELKIGSERVTLELTKDELALIEYCYVTSHGNYNNYAKDFFGKLEALKKHMDYLKEVETAISEVYNEK